MSIEKINSSSMYNENLYFYNDENQVIMDAILDSQRVVEDGKQRTKRENFGKIIAYNKLISLVSKLVTELSLPNNSLSMSLVISRLIYSGYFSNRMNFRFGDEDDELYGALGMSIVKGKGVCRHIASFSKDIFDELDLYNYLLPCVCEARLTEEEGFLIKPNHVVNLIEYDGNLYPYDSANEELFEFETGFLMRRPFYTSDMKLCYKPSMDMILNNISLEEAKQNVKLFEECSKNYRISYYVFKEIIEETCDKIVKSKSSLSDFKSDAKPIIKRIVSK